MKRWLLSVPVPCLLLIVGSEEVVITAVLNKRDLRHLAFMDFVLEHYEEIPPELLNVLCPGWGNF
jgi:hypothetical protein